MDFNTKKKEILDSYHMAKLAQLVDPEIYQINDAINQHEFWVTTSSCAGRVILISKKELRAKYETTFHYKSHNPQEIISWDFESVEFEGDLWLLMESPNLHVFCRDIPAAKHLVTLGLKAKLGKSKYQSIDPQLVVEILGTSNMQVPLGSDGEILTSSIYIEFLLREIMKSLYTEQNRLDTFYQLLVE